MPASLADTLRDILVLRRLKAALNEIAEARAKAVALSAPAAEPPVIHVTYTGPVQIHATSLSLSVDRLEQVIDFKPNIDLRPEIHLPAPVVQVNLPQQTAPVIHVQPAEVKVMATSEPAPSRKRRIVIDGPNGEYTGTVEEGGS